MAKKSPGSWPGLNGKTLNRQPDSNIPAPSSQWLRLGREFGMLADTSRSEQWAAVSYRFNKSGRLTCPWKPQIIGLEPNGAPGPLYYRLRKLRDQFEELAAQAGVELGAAPVPTDDPDSLLHLDARVFWLRRVFADLLGLPPGHVIERSGEVENVCEACAEFCSRFQAEAEAAGNAVLPAQPQTARAESAEPEEHVQPTNSHKASRTLPRNSKLTGAKLAIAKILEGDSKASDKRICNLLDKWNSTDPKVAPILDTWKAKPNVRLWIDALHNPKLKNAVHTYISKVRRQVGCAKGLS